jgi:hypothetical protein
MKRLVCAGLALAFCITAHANVVRPAPDFRLADVQGANLHGYRGQTVVLLVTRSARDKYFRAEVERLKSLYAEFSNEKVLFVAAIENGPQEVRSDIPFVIAANPAQVAANYGVNGRFGIAVIGVDGNLDLITDRLIAPERVRDTVFNNYESQNLARTPLPAGSNQ